MFQYFTHFFLFRIVNDFFYVGGQLNVENLAGNQFVNFAVVALTLVSKQQYELLPKIPNLKSQKNEIN